ncbi:hypothetical protein [Rhodococcus sp. KRD197]|uniref:hypothetical protein n=1 Tax=Rhodococcus sp. KRD197 TaxID=2729731 RepID=UPI001F49B11F|nr:hypothetical protein [Rhodococcus sp. KRD197]
MHTTGGIKTGAAIASGVTATGGTIAGSGASAAGGTIVVDVVVVATVAVVEEVGDAALGADGSSADPHAAMMPAVTNPAAAMLTDRTTRPLMKRLALGSDWPNLIIVHTFEMSTRDRS